MHVELHNHVSLVEMGRNAVIAPSGLDGVAEELSLTVVSCVTAEIGSLRRTHMVYQ